MTDDLKLDSATVGHPLGSQRAELWVIRVIGRAAWAFTLQQLREFGIAHSKK